MGRYLAVFGGAFGLGLGRNVRKLYAELVRVYERGDRIFLFGFSRGAFTVRTLSGLIAACGIVDRLRCTSDDDLWGRVAQAYNAYRDRYRTLLMQIFRGPASDKPQSVVDVRTHWAVQHEGDRGGNIESWQVPIAFVGVWDTVDAVGFPIPGLAELWNTTIFRFKFPDHVLGPMVQRARHALAIDDERHTFHPLVWNEAPKHATAQLDPERIQQVWFSGAHSNVGGGYPKQGMSVVSLAWMMDEVERSGLRFSPGDRQLYHERQNIYDKLYDSRSGTAFFYRYKPRDIDRICHDHQASCRIHVSVIERVLDAPEGYAPGNIPRTAQIVGPTVPVVDKTADSMRDQLGDAASVLDHVRGLVTCRRVTHLLVLGIAMLVTIMALRHAEWSLSQMSAGGLIQAVGTFVVAAISGARWWVVTLILAMISAYGVNWALTRRMKGIFSTFWFVVRSRGRDLGPPSDRV